MLYQHITIIKIINIIKVIKVCNTKLNQSPFSGHSTQRIGRGGCPIINKCGIGNLLPLRELGLKVYESDMSIYIVVDSQKGCTNLHVYQPGIFSSILTSINCSSFVSFYIMSEFQYLMYESFLFCVLVCMYINLTQILNLFYFHSLYLSVHL